MSGENEVVESTLNIDDAVSGIAQDLRLAEPKEAAEIPVEVAPEEPAEIQEASAPAAQSSPAATPEQPTSPETAEASPPATPSDDKAPDTWTKAGKERWAAIAPEVRAEIKKREADIAKFVGESQPALNVAKGFEKIITPYLPLAQQYGINPWDHVAGLLKAHATIVMGQPHERAALFRQLAADAGIDLAQLASASPTAQNETVAPLQARIEQMQARINQLEQGVTGVTTDIQASRTAELEKQVLAFAQDEASHPFFYDLVDDIRGILQSGAAKTLEDAYATAVAANPVTRQKLIEREIAQRAEATAKADREKVEKARKAAAGNVRANGRGRAASPAVSIDETLRETLAEINSRT